MRQPTIHINLQNMQVFLLSFSFYRFKKHLLTPQQALRKFLVFFSLIQTVTFTIYLPTLLLKSSYSPFYLNIFIQTLLRSV